MDLAEEKWHVIFGFLDTSIQKLDLLTLIRDIIFSGMGKRMVVGCHEISLHFNVYLFVHSPGHSTDQNLMNSLAQLLLNSLVSEFVP